MIKVYFILVSSPKSWFRFYWDALHHLESTFVRCIRGSILETAGNCMGGGLTRVVILDGGEGEEVGESR